MQQRNTYISIALAVAMVVGANAQNNNIVSFGDGVAGTDYDIDDPTGEITIYTANGNDYAFWAEDSSGGPGTGFIDNIILDDPDSMTGNFSLLIADPVYPNDPEEPGALHWDAGDLTFDDGTATVINVHLAGNLAGDGDIVCDDVTGTVKCGDIDNGITIQGDLTGSITANDVSGAITIDGNFNGDVTVNTLADFTGGDFGTTVDGDIAIAQGYSGTMTINELYSGDITVGGEMSGKIDLNGNMYSASITIGTPGANANLTGEIEMRAGGVVLVNGNVSSGGLIDVNTFLSGQLEVTGDLDGGIYVVSEIASTGRIHIVGNHNGQIDIARDLDKGGRIKIDGNVTQTDASTPAIHIHGWLDGEERNREK